MGSSDIFGSKDVSKNGVIQPPSLLDSAFNGVTLDDNSSLFNLPKTFSSSSSSNPIYSAYENITTTNNPALIDSPNQQLQPLPVLSYSDADNNIFNNQLSISQPVALNTNLVFPYSNNTFEQSETTQTLDPLTGSTTDTSLGSTIVQDFLTGASTPIPQAAEPPTALKFIQDNQLRLKIFENNVVVEDIKGNQNQEIPNTFTRLQITAINSSDLPNVADDTTFSDQGEGIGIADGDDGNSASRKRIDKDEALQIKIRPTATYNSALTATLNVDLVESITNNTPGGTIKIVALRGAGIVGEQNYTLTSKTQQLSFSNNTAFDRLQIIAGNDDTKFTLRATEFQAILTPSPTPTYLKFSQNATNLKIEENGVTVEQVATQLNQPVQNTFQRLGITAIDSASGNPLIDTTKQTNNGIGITDGDDNTATLQGKIDGNEILQVNIKQTPNYNSALSAVVGVDLVKAINGNSQGGKIKIVALRNGALVGSKTFNISNSAELGIQQLRFISNQAFDRLQIMAGDNNTEFTLSSVEFEAVTTDIPVAGSLKLIQDGTQIKLYENEVLAELVQGGQNQPIPNTLNRIIVTTLDSPDTSNFVDRTFLDQGEGIGIADGDDGNSASRKRIDSDEVLQFKIQPTEGYNSATKALIGINQVRSITSNTSGGKVKIVALFGTTVVEEQIYNLNQQQNRLTFTSNQAFDTLRVSAGDNNTQFTFNLLEFTVKNNTDTTAPVITAALVNDTAPNNTTNSDKITSDPTISGKVIDASNVVEFKAGIDDIPPANYQSVLPQRLADGSFKFERAQLETINGGVLADGTHTLHLFATDSVGNKSAVVDFTFTLDTKAPAEPILFIDPALSSSNNNNLQTTASAVTLRGQTEAGATVVLEQTNITTTADYEGKFQFTPLNLNVGANAFSFRIIDVAGNTQDPFSTTIIRASNNDVVLDWNATLLRAVQTDRSAPPLAARNMAMVHAAVYDAVNSITHKYSSYKVDIPVPVGASTGAAAAEAAYRVLINLYPQQQATFDSALAASLAAIPDGQSETDGVAVGQQVADAILAWRSNDGANVVKAYSPGTNPGDWQPTPPSYGGATLSQWADVKTFAMTSGSQFRPSGPPALNSDKYTADFNQVKDIGKIDSTTRTAEQTEIAKFWADGAGTYTPPGHWNQIAEQVAVKLGTSLEDNARLFALLNIGLADAGIACWDAKYTYNFWRPITAIRNADTDGNPNTTSDPNWTPLLVTPSFGDYVSGHSTFSGVADAVLTNIYGNNFNFSTTTVGLPGVTRSFDSFTDAASEAGISRIYGGIHFASANTSGLASGRALGNYITQNFLKTKEETGLIQAALANDTSPNGTNTDGITSDATVAGKITIPNNGNIRVLAGFGDTAVANYRDITASVDASGNFNLDVTKLATIYGAAIADGIYKLKLRLENTQGNLLSDFELAFTLDTAKPILTVDVPSSEGTISSKARLIGSANGTVNIGTAGVGGSGNAGTGNTIASARYRIDGQAYAPLTLSTTDTFSQVIAPSGLTAGQHNVELEVFDAAGNSTKTPTNFTVSNDFFVGGSNTEGWGSKTDNSVVLAEQNSFVTQTAMTVKLGQPTDESGQAVGKRTIEFDLNATFDTTDATASEDRFGVYLVDTNNPTQTLLDRGEKGTALFSLAGLVAEYTPGLVTYDGTKVRIDVTSLANKTSGSLVFQLINNDGDQSSVVSVKNLTDTLDIKGSANPVFPTQNNLADIGGAIANLSTFTNTNNAKLQVTNVRLDTTTGKYTADLQVENVGTTTLSRQLAVLLTNLPNGVSIQNASGTHPAGSPYINLSNAIRPGGLAAGTISDAVQIVFNDPQLLRFEVQPVFLAGAPEQVPTLQNPGSLTVKPGERLALPLVASDPNGDPITFSIRGDKPLPKGKLDGEGKLVFNPSPAEIGTYNLTLVATSGGAEATQNVTLTVAPDPITTTRISGVIQNTDQAPLAGIVIELAGRQVLTAEDGSFQLEFTGAVPSDVLKVRANQLNEGNVVYPFIAEKLPLVLEHEVYEGVNNVIERPIYLPPLDVANGKTVNPNADTTISSPLLPGSAVYVAAGSLNDENGNPFTGKLSITEVPPNLTPAALPENLRPDIVVTIQPGEMVFNTPARLSLPNRAGYAAGLEMDLWSINPNTGLFDKVGVGKVSADGKVIETISGGIRNSSWHFFGVIGTPIDISNNPFNKNIDKESCPANESINSEVELFSGEVQESHDLITYQSLGETRGLTLKYSSLRADSRPIVHFGYENVRVVGVTGSQMVASLAIKKGNFSYQVPGVAAGQNGLLGGENVWSIPASGGKIDAALQADLRSLPSGQYTYELTTGLLASGFSGSLTTSTGKLISVNTINSSFGSGWGLAGLQEIVQNDDGSVLLIDGDGSYSLFKAPSTTGSAYVSPDGDFSTLERLADGAFRRTMKDKTVYQFNAQNKLTLMRDRIGNSTQYSYNAAGQIAQMVDPAGLTTKLTYTNGKVSEIIDPANRITKLEYDTKGNLIKIIDPDTYARRWEYDNEHHMTAATDKQGNRGQDFYDFAGRVNKAITKDGSVIQVNPVEVQGLYRKEQTINPSAAPVAKPLDAAEASYADGNGNVVRTKLDRAGQTISETDGAGAMPSVERNARNLVTKSTDARGSNTTEYTYDSKGNVLSIKDEFSKDTSPTYDLFPNRVYKTGSNPQQIVSADLDKDGRIDLVSADSNDNSLSILFGDGKGSFSAATKVAVGDRPVSVAVGDISGDGNEDLVSANNYSDNISVSLGNGQGTFSTVTDIAVGTRPSFITLGDLDSDGDLDFIIGYGYGSERNSISVLLNDGSGNFTNTADYTTGREPGTVTVADVSGDGRLDLVSANSGTDTLSVLLNNGNGTFADKIDYTVGSYPESVAVGDVNGDGRLDVVTANSYSNNVSVLLNNGNSTFASNIDYAVGGSAKSVSLGDINGDGRLDVVTANSYSNNVSVLLNNGNGTFASNIDYTVRSSATSVVLGDANKDGHLDILTANLADNSISVLFNNGDGSFKPEFPPVEPVREYDLGYARNVLLADVNNDGVLDLVTAAGNAAIRLGNSNGSFSPAINYNIDFSANSFALEDLNGDKFADLVATGLGSNYFSVLYNNGDGTFAPQRKYNVGNSIRAVSVGDINGDGRADVIISDSYPNNVSVLLSNGDGTFAPKTNYNFEYNLSELLLADVNGDTKLDLIARSGSDVFVLLNNGNGTFAPKTNYGLGGYEGRLAAADINKDGRVDIVAANSYDNTVSVLLNNGNGTFAPKTDYKVGDSPQGVSIGDVNDDGHLDLLITNYNDDTVSVLFGNSTGTFNLKNSLNFRVGDGPQSIALGDLDLDGDLDFVAGSYYSNKTSVHLNNTIYPVNIGQEKRYTYDSIYNKVTSETDELGRKTLYEIDPLTGNMLSTTKVVGVVGGDDDVVTRYTYTLNGQIDTMTDALGRVTDYDYNAIGRLIKTTFAFGTVDEASQQFEYDGAGNQTAIIDEKGHRTEFVYNAMNMLVKTIEADPDGVGVLISPVTSYAYDKDGHQTSMTDARNNVMTSDYDNMGRLVKTTDAKGGVTRYTYDKAGNQVSVVDALGRETKSIYDARNRLIETINPDGSSYKPNYDFDNNLTSNIDAKGNRNNQVYDARGRLIREIDALGNITRYEYDAANQLVATIDANGNKTRYKYDDLGRQIEVIDALGHITKTEYNKVGNVVANTDALGRTTRYTYDNRNRQKVLTDALGYTTTTNYDAVGNTIAQADQLGQTTQFTYDAQNRQTSITDPLNHTTTYTYDAVDNLADITDALGRTTQYGYDALNRRTTVTNALGDTSVANYDAVGNTIAITDELGRTTLFTYDIRDRITATIDPLEHKITREYDANSNLTAVTDANGQTTRYGYDALNRRYSVTDARNKTTTTTYDAVGKVSTIIDPVGNTTAYSYDALDRLVAEKNQQGKTRSYEYDAVGNQVAAYDRNGRKRTFTYDDLDRQTAEKWLDASGLAIATMSYAYDAVDRLISANDPNSSYTYTYDANGRLTSANNINTPGVPNVVLGYTYDAVSNRLNVTDTINGTQRGTESFTYDALNRVTRITQSGNGVTAKRVDMAYDKASQIKSITRYADNVGTQLVADSGYNYDLAGRLTNLTHKRGTTTLAAYTFDYDAADRITKFTSPDGTSDYSYDATNQLVGTDHSFQADENYSYDANGNRTNAGYQNGTDNRLLSDGKYNYEYDNEGNRTKRTEIATGKITEYGWDYNNRLVKVVDKDVNSSITKQADYTYDIFGNRIAKSVDADGASNAAATVERFVYDDDHIALTFDGNGTQTHRYMHGVVVDQILADENSTGQVSWALTDNQGSVRDVVDSAGTVVNHIIYDGFGGITNQSNPTASIRFGYTGREFDTETGDYYYRARYYDPSVGEFISEDPIGFAGRDVNLYRYVANSPVNGIDPMGNFVIQPSGGLGGFLKNALGVIGTAVEGFSAGTIATASVLATGIVLLLQEPTADETRSLARPKQPKITDTPTPSPTPTSTPPPAPNPNPTSTPIPIPRPEPDDDPNNCKTCEKKFPEYSRWSEVTYPATYPGSVNPWHFGGYRYSSREKAFSRLKDEREARYLSWADLEVGKEGASNQSVPCKTPPKLRDKAAKHFNVLNPRKESAGSLAMCRVCVDYRDGYEQPRLLDKYGVLNVKDNTGNKSYVSLAGPPEKPHLERNGLYP